MWSQFPFVSSISYRTVSEISPFYIKIANWQFFSKFRTHDLEVLSPNYEKALLLSIGNIAAKFEDATTPCIYAPDNKVRSPPAHPPPQAITITQAGCGLKRMMEIGSNWFLTYSQVGLTKSIWHFLLAFTFWPNQLESVSNKFVNSVNVLAN